VSGAEVLLIESRLFFSSSCGGCDPIAVVFSAPS